MVAATPQWSLLGETVGNEVLAESSKTETAPFFLFFFFFLNKPLHFFKPSFYPEGILAGSCNEMCPVPVGVSSPCSSIPWLMPHGLGCPQALLPQKCPEQGRVWG